jgi:hypothetical protein
MSLKLIDYINYKAREDFAYELTRDDFQQLKIEAAQGLPVADATFITFCELMNDEGGYDALA